MSNIRKQSWQGAGRKRWHATTAERDVEQWKRQLCETAETNY